MEPSRNANEEILTISFVATPFIFLAGIFVMGYISAAAGLIMMVLCFVVLAILAART